ncbi:unnamed protein product, partial [Rotaria sp. Silwood1]
DFASKDKYRQTVTLAVTITLVMECLTRSYLCRHRPASVYIDSIGKSTESVEQIIIFEFAFYYFHYGGKRQESRDLAFSSIKTK